MPNLGGEQSLGLDNSGPKLADFANRPAGKLHGIIHFVSFYIIIFLYLHSVADSLEVHIFTVYFDFQKFNLYLFCINMSLRFP